MTKLHEEIETMQRRMTEAARTEQAFVSALGEALTQVDQHLLNEVRRLGAEHQARRGAILNELRSLAGSLCQFPPVEHEPIAQLDAVAPAAEPVARLVDGQPHAPGDWRRATSNIEEDLDVYWRAPGSSH